MSINLEVRNEDCRLELRSGGDDHYNSLVDMLKCRINMGHAVLDGKNGPDPGAKILERCL